MSPKAVVAVAGFKQVVAGASVELVVAVSGGQRVVSGLSTEHVGSVAGTDQVTTSSSEDPVRAVSGSQCVVAAGSVDGHGPVDRFGVDEVGRGATAQLSRLDSDELIDSETIEGIGLEREVGVGPLVDAIVPRSAVERVETGAALQHVAAAALSMDEIVAQRSVEGVTASASPQRVLAIPGRQHVIAGVAIENVGTGTGHQRVGAGATDQRDVAREAGGVDPVPIDASTQLCVFETAQQIVAEACHQRVGQREVDVGRFRDDVQVVSPDQQIVTIATGDRVVSGLSIDGIVSGQAVE